jgi:hypothetical protein
VIVERFRVSRGHIIDFTNRTVRDPFGVVVAAGW